MPRRLGDEVNEMRFQDNLSNSEIVLYYRMPTTEERIAYNNESFQRKGNKLVNQVTATRIKYGLKILQGFREGDFEDEQPGGKWRPISSDPQSRNYIAGWKDLVTKYASDLIEHLAMRVFDIPIQMAEKEEDQESNIGDHETENISGAPASWPQRHKYSVEDIDQD